MCSSKGLCSWKRYVVLAKAKDDKILGNRDLQGPRTKCFAHPNTVSGSINQGTLSGGPFSNNYQPLTVFNTPLDTAIPLRGLALVKHMQMNIRAYSRHSCSETKMKTIKQTETALNVYQ